MLNQLFATIIFLIIFFIAVIIIKIALPMYRFLSRADAVSRLYPLVMTVVRKNTAFDNEVVMSLGNKLKIKFSNSNEASIEYEKMITEALDYYDKLGWIAIVDDTFKNERDRLVDICSEIRKLRWQMQGSKG